MAGARLRGTVDLDYDYLRASALPTADPRFDDLSIVDLFAGCGGLTLGAIEGARRSGRSARLAVAIDHDWAPLDVLDATLSDPRARFATADLATELHAFGERIRASESKLFEGVTGNVLLVAGPPCQGHSALNNSTRYDDARNDLYLKVARAARIVKPTAVIVENVSGVGRDRRKAATRCSAALQELGFEVTAQRVDLSTIGVPQRRVRHVLVATQDRKLDWDLPSPPIRDVSWAIGDLVDKSLSSPFDQPSRPTRDNQLRIDYLFDRGKFDLPNPRRPRCHRSSHSYVSMYGRLRWDEPAQTITSGYGSMGQGRFVHPLRRRTLTPHEAARLQCLPDFVAFEIESRRTKWATMIGNAVPPVFGASLVEALIAQRLL